MRVQSSKGRFAVAFLLTALVAFGLAASAQAKLVGEYVKFAQCPYTNLEVKKCIVSVTNSGEVVLGSVGSAERLDYTAEYVDEGLRVVVPNRPLSPADDEQAWLRSIVIVEATQETTEP